MSIRRIYFALDNKRVSGKAGRFLPGSSSEHSKHSSVQPPAPKPPGLPTFSQSAFRGDVWVTLTVEYRIEKRPVKFHDAEQPRGVNKAHRVVDDIGIAI